MSSLFALITIHNIYICTFGMGVLLNFVLCKLLKKLLHQSRPVVDLQGTTMKNDKDGGMPSRTTAMLVFYFVFISLTFFESWQNHFLPFLVAMYIFCGSNLFLRWKYQYHTFAQMIVGISIGFSASFLWYFLTRDFLNPYFTEFTMESNYLQMISSSSKTPLLLNL